jgi:Polyketide cyclase / dehydrase and lipid transport
MGALDTMVVQVSCRLPADPAQIWALLADVERMAGLGPEHTEAHWVETGPALGAQFTGRNARAGREWTVPCLVDVCEPPTRFGWVVGDPQQPSARWRYDLRADGAGGTEVTQRFVHGPGFSFLRRAIEKYPDRETELVSARSAELAANMRATLSAAGDLL